MAVIRDQLFTGYSGIQFCFVLKAGSSLNSFFKRMLLLLAFNIEVWKRAGHCALPCVKRKYGDLRQSTRAVSHELLPGYELKIRARMLFLFISSLFMSKKLNYCVCF